MAELFSDNARHVLELAREEAAKLGSELIEPEHLLLALVARSEGSGARLLRHLGVSPKRIHDEVGSLVSPLPEIDGGVPVLSPAAQRVLEVSAAEGRKLGHEHVGSEHVLLALLGQPDHLVLDILERVGLDLETARRQLADWPRKNGVKTPAGEADDAADGAGYEFALLPMLGAFAAGFVVASILVWRCMHRSRTLRDSSGARSAPGQ